MKKNTKALLLSVCAVVIAVASMVGTIAYLTDTEAVKNTFTVGKVGLSLDEAKVTEDGKPVENADRVQENKYHLIPGHTYTKDPTVTVDAGSEKSYVRMIVTVNFEEALTDEQLATSLDGIFLGYDANLWGRHEKTVSTDKKTITYEYRYYTTVDGKDATGKDAAQKLEPLFTSIQVPGEYTNEQIAFLDGMTISVEAHAIQADGFANADVAWAIFN